MRNTHERTFMAVISAYAPVIKTISHAMTNTTEVLTAAAASAKGLQKDLLGVLSLFSSVEHWSKNNTGVCTDFVKTVFIKSNYRLSFELLSEQCNCGEKTLRNCCKKYIAYYEDKRQYYKTLPLSMLFMKYITNYWFKGEGGMLKTDYNNMPYRG